MSKKPITEPDDSEVRRAKLTVAPHEPSLDEVAKMRAIRDPAADLIAAIMHNAPSCADASAAIRSVRLAVMQANAAIALRGTDPTRD